MAIGGSGKGIQIVVGTDYNDRDLKRAQRDLDHLKREAARTASPMQKLGNTLRANVAPALAMAAAAAGALAVKFAVDGVKAAAAEQVAMAKLETALRNVGQAFAIDEVNTFLDGLQRATGISEDQLRPAFQQLVTATRDVAKAQELLQLAMDISVQTGKPLEAVTLALAKAATGQTAALRKLGVPLSDAAIKSGDLAVITGELTDAFGGATAAAARTFQGQLQRLAIAASEVQEAFGQGFLSAFGDTTDNTNEMMDAIAKLEPIMYDLGENIGTLVMAMADLEEATGILTAIFKGFLDVTGPTLDAILYFYRVMVLGQDPLEAFKQQFFGLGEAGQAAADGFKAAGSEFGGGDWVTGATSDFGDLNTEVDTTVDLMAQLNAALALTNATVGFQKSIDDLRKAMKENNGALSIYNEKGREGVDAFTALASAAGRAIEATTNQAEQANVASTALSELETQLGNTKMDPATAAAVLAPFQALIDSLRDAGVDVTALQAQMDRLESKVVTATVVTKYTYIGTPPPGGYTTEKPGKKKASGGLVVGPGTGTSDSIPTMLSDGEFVIRASSVKRFGADLFSQLNRGINPLAGMSPTSSSRAGGVSIGTINVTSVAGERAETSLPRALRRMAFLAGMNG